MNCLLCKGKPRKGLPLCYPCFRELPWHPVDTIGFRYKSPVDHWITRLKFHDELHYAKILGQLFAEKLKRQTLPECIIPIPLSTRRLCYRGFNQALEIANVVGKTLKVPIKHNLLKRRKHTKPQSELTEDQREKNLAQAFICRKNITAKSIALFDDVITTGSTMKAAVEALQKQTGANIKIWGCSKTKKGPSGPLL